jgi:hypothetical protein
MPAHNEVKRKIRPTFHPLDLEVWNFHASKNGLMQGFQFGVATVA